MAQESVRFQTIAMLAGDQAPQALAWFEQLSPTIEYWMRQPTLREGAYALLHGDLRSDNLSFIR